VRDVLLLLLLLHICNLCGQHSAGLHWWRLLVWLLLQRLWLLLLPVPRRVICSTHGASGVRERHSRWQQASGAPEREHAAAI
jgi:hypothetical protein